MTAFGQRILALGLALGLTLGGLTGPARADGPLVVVELFTSQGCSSCPPADALLEELVEWPHVLPLALHVDYWDYIGWPDTFADPAFTDRQKDYARAADSRVIYTPQIVIGGQEVLERVDPMKLAKIIHRHAAEPALVKITVSDREVVLHRDGAAMNPLVIQRVDYLPGETVEITAGENAGRAPFYANVVRHWEVLSVWDGQADLILTLPERAGLKTVILAQENGPGPIRAAARVGN